MGDPGRKVVVMEAGLRARRWAVRSLPVVGFVLLAMFSFGGSAHADTYNGDVEVNSGEADAFDLRDTCSSVRSNLAAWFGGPSPLRPLPIKLPGFESALTLGQTTITINCGALNELSIAGSFAYKDQPSVAVELELTWGDSSTDAVPDVSFDLDSTKTVAQDPIFSVADTVEWITGLFGDPAAIDAGPLGGADISIRKLILDADWTEADGFAIDATASTLLEQGDTAEVSDDLLMGYLLSVTKPAAEDSEAVTLAGVHIANQDNQAKTFNLGGVLRGAAGELITDLELPEMYLATVQPSTARIKTSELRPVALAFFSEHGPDPAGLPPKDGDVNDSELTFDGDLTIGANVELDWFGGRVRDALGYAPGAQLQMIGEVGFSVADLFGPEADLDLQEVAIDVLLPDITGADGALIPDWVDLKDGRIQIFWDHQLSILQVELDAEAHAIVIDNSQAPGWDPANPDAATADPYEFPIVFDVAGLVEVIDEGGESTFVAALQAKTAAEGNPGPAWPHPFGQTWLDLDAVGGELKLIVPAGGTTTFDAELVSTFQIGGKNFRFSGAVDYEQGVGTDVVLNLSMYDTISLNEVLGLFGDFQIPPEIFNLTIGTEQVVDPPDPANPDAVDQPDGPPVSITARVEAPDAGGFNAYFAVNAPATFDFAGVQLPMNFLFSIAQVDGDLQLIVGGRTDPTKLSTILSGPLGEDFIAALPDGFDFDLPAAGLVFNSTDLDLQSADLVNDRPEEHEFFRHLYGCGDPPNPDCTYRVQLDSGFHLLSAITLPNVEQPASATTAGDDELAAQTTSTTTEPVFADVFRAFGMDPMANPPAVLFDAAVAVEDPTEGIEFGSIGVKLRFPIKPAERPDWFHDASVGIGFAFDAQSKTISFEIDGELAIRMRDETEDEATCTGVMLTVVQGQAEKKCYDVLEFKVGAAVNISATPSLTLKGSIISDDGWTGPFGLEFLEFNSLALVLDITVQGSSPVVTIGFMMSGSLILDPGDPANGVPPVKKDLAGSFAVGLRIVAPSPPYVIPQFQGLRIATKVGVELYDVVRLYDIVREQTAILAAEAENAGLFDDFPALEDFTQLPPLVVDESQLPNVAVRNVELMIGLGNFEDVCITPGFKLTGELYLNPTQPAPDVEASTPNNCFGEPLRPEECLTRPTPVPAGGLDPCFAAVSVDVGLGGIYFAGAQGDMEFGPVYIDDSLFELELSPTVQRIRTYGGGGIRGIAEGDMSVTIGSDGLAVLGDVVLFPTTGGADAFRAKIEAEATAGLNGVDFTQLDFSDPASLLALKFDLNAVLQADFEALVQNTAGQSLAVLRDAAVTMDVVYQAIKASDGDTVDALRQLPGELRARGVVVPPWLENPDPDGFDLLDAITELEDTLEPFGVELPGLDTLFDGVPLDPPLPGIPGVWIPETKECHQVFFGLTSPTLGVEVGGTCYTYEPGTWLGGVDGVLGRFVHPQCYSVYPLAGTVLTNAAGEKECWSVPPLTELPGLCDLGLDAVLQPCSFNTFLTELVEPALADVLVAAGLPGDLTFTEMIDLLIGQLDGLTPPVTVPCASFRLITSDGQTGGTSTAVIDLNIDAQVFGVDIDLGAGWDFSASPTSQGAALFGDLLDAVLGRAPTAVCEDLGTISVAGGGAGGGSATGTLPPRTGINAALAIALAADDVVEGDEAVLELSGLDSLLPDTPLVVDWGDGTSPWEGTAGTAPDELRHAYRDDDPTGTSIDSYTVTASAGGLAPETETLVVRNAAPAELTVTPPGELEEGDTLRLTGSFTDLGVDDTHRVRIVWGDGSAPTEIDVEPTCAELTDACRTRSFSASHEYLDDDDDDTYLVRVTVEDDDGGLRGFRMPVTVRNVAPSNLAITPMDEEGEDAASVPEGSLVLYRVSFDDPGVLDTHRVTVDWGDGTTSVAPARSRTAVLSHRYMDDHPETGTPSDLLGVSLTVVDDDGGSAADDLAVRVDNVDPTVSIAKPLAAAGGDAGTVLADGPEDEDPEDRGELETPTFLTRAGTSLRLEGQATDPGSDDLTFTWDWDTSDRFDTSTSETTHDAVRSPKSLPQDVTASATHTWTQPCLYEVGLRVTDDDTGAGSDSTWVVVTGTDDRLRRPGWWYNQYDFSGKRNRNDISEDTATCYLETVRHMSRVLSAYRSCAHFTEAMAILNTRQSSDGNEIMVRQLLASWLNFAHGSIGWFDLVDTDGDGSPDMPFHEVIAAAEALRLDPNAGRAELLAYEDVLERINGE